MSFHIFSELQLTIKYLISHDLYDVIVIVQDVF